MAQRPQQPTLGSTDLAPFVHQGQQGLLQHVLGVFWRDTVLGQDSPQTGLETIQEVFDGEVSILQLN